MTWFWVEGYPLAVEATQGGLLPAVLIWQGTRHPVAGIVACWRVDTSWWEARVWRDYFRLHTQTGLLLVVFHDLTADRWRLERLYD